MLSHTAHKKPKMNILQSFHLVNYKNLNPQKNKLFQFQLASEIFYLESPIKENFVEVASELGFTYHTLADSQGVPKQDKCSKNMPFFIAENPIKNESHERKNKEKKELYPEAFENSSHIKLFKSVLRVTLQKFVNRWSVAGAERKGDWTFFVANAKGTKQYFTKQYWRFHDVCGKLDKCYRYHFFDTVTCDPSQFSGDLIIRYRQFSERIGEYCRYMSRFIKGKCVCVIESTASGLPHAHIIYYTNVEFSDIKERHKKGTKYNYIYDGILKQMSLKWWSNGFCELRKDEKGDTANYLSKYLSKVSETDIRSMLKKKHWNKTDLKTVLTVLLPVLSCVRQFRLPQLKNLVELSPELEKEVEFSAEEKARPVENLAPLPKDDLFAAARLRAYLKALMIKSPNPCIFNVVMANYAVFTQKHGENFDEINALPKETKKEIAKGCVRMSCGGCLFSRLLLNVLFDEPFYTEEVDNSHYFESFVFSRWLGFYNEIGFGKKWAENEKSQDLFVQNTLRAIAEKCGGAVASGSLQLMLEKHHSLWVSILPKEVLRFGIELIEFNKDSLTQKQDSLNVYDSFQKTFRKFLLTISASGDIIVKK